MKRSGVFSKALEKTLVGWLVFSFVLPAIAIWSGFHGLVDGEVNIRGADVSGLPARLYGAGFISFGIGALAQPRSDEPNSSFHAIRILAGSILALLLVIAASIGLFL